MSIPAPIVVIGGPTATGKTALAITLAEHLERHGIPAEIVSVDSRQVYRGLDIGTAKATAAERARVVHHGLDLVEPDEPFSVADFRAHALAALAALGARSGIAILAGGTGFWLQAITGGLDTDALPFDPALRARLESDLAVLGVAALAERLAREAPTLATTVDARNPRRVVRALEIAGLRGDGPRPTPRGYAAPTLTLLLDRDRADHRAAIAARARAQFDAGLVDEAAGLRERFDPMLPAFSAIGYREAWAMLDGELDREAAIALDTARIIAFARRQRTWFRRLDGIRLEGDAEGGDRAREALDRFADGVLTARAGQTR